MSWSFDGGGTAAWIGWLDPWSPMASSGRKLNPAQLTDGDLRTICIRMHAILDTVEMPRCEGRLLPVRLFDAIDELAGRDRNPTPNDRLDDADKVETCSTYWYAGIGTKDGMGCRPDPNNWTWPAKRGVVTQAA